MNEHITLRRVTADDAKLLFEWRNDAETRKQSRTTASVEWEGHVRWLESSLQNPDRILVIAETEGLPLGTCRADLRQDGFTEISYTLAPVARGKGLSKPMVIQFVSEFLRGRRIVAGVKKGHKPSESVAAVLGLSPFCETPSDDPDDLRPMAEWR